VPGNIRNISLPLSRPASGQLLRTSHFATIKEDKNKYQLSLIAARDKIVL